VNPNEAQLVYDVLKADMHQYQSNNIKNSHGKKHVGVLNSHSCKSNYTESWHFISTDYLTILFTIREQQSKWPGTKWHCSSQPGD